MAANSTADRWPALWTLFGAYFTEDFDDDYGSPDGTLDGFRSEEPSEIVEAAIDEARELAASSAIEDELRETVVELGLCYRPWLDGWSCRGWLEHVVERLGR